MEASLLFPFSSMLTEALILHMADRSDADMAKYIDRKVFSGRFVRGDERSSNGKVSVKRQPCASVEEKKNTQINLMTCNFTPFYNIISII